MVVQTPLSLTESAHSFLVLLEKKSFEFPLAVGILDKHNYVTSIFRNPATFLHAYTCLPLAYSTRQAAGAILQDVADSGVLFAILMCKHKVCVF